MDSTKNRISNFLRWYEQKKDIYGEFSRCVLDKISFALKERNIIYAYDSCRAKSLDSLSVKCKKKIYNKDTDEYELKYNDPKKQITDFAGVRIVCYLPQDIPPIQHIIENMFEIDRNNSMNKVDILKDNEVGYLSVHYVVSLKKDEIPYEQKKYKGMKCEIQIRTVLQDAWSQVFHDRQYKCNTTTIDSVPNSLIRDTNLVAGALELIDKEIGNLAVKYDELAINISNTDYQELLDEQITRENLKRYFEIKFANINLLYYSYEDILKNMARFDLVCLRDIDEMFDERLTEEIKQLDYQLTIDKVLMYGMIAKDAEKFFEYEENKNSVISKKSYKFLDKFIDIKYICKKYNIQQEVMEE